MLRAFIRSPRGLVSLSLIALVVVIAAIGPPLFGAGANGLTIVRSNLGPSGSHLLGTNALGQDIFDRILVATRTTLLLALAATGIGAGAGILAGTGVAMLHGRWRAVSLRAIDALIVFPGLIIAIIVGVIVGKGATGAVLGVGIAGVFAFARVASTLAMSVSGRDYVDAARVVGIRRTRMLGRYILPNIADTLAITTTVVIAGSIVQLSALSFLGLGVQPPSYTWGTLLTQGLKVFTTHPAAALGPVSAIALASLIFGFAGEEAAPVLNPLLWARRRGVPGTTEPAFASAVPGVVDTTEKVERAVHADVNEDDVLRVQGLTVSFPRPGRGRFDVVDGVSFTVHKGEVLGIVGESGSGKTMTALGIARLIGYPGEVTGRIEILGREVERVPLRQVDKILGTDLAIVFQDPQVSLNPALRIGVQLTEASRVHLGLSRKAAVELAVGRLGEVGLPGPRHLLRRYPHELSGGMKQRTMIAMGLMHEPAILIADEPTTSLDVTVQAQILDLLRRINREHGTSVVLISHDLGLVSQICDRVLVMYAGRIVEELTAAQLAARPVHPYTRALVGAIPDMSHPADVPLTAIPGQVPDLAMLPAGCPYHPRCPFAEDVCRVDRPPLRHRADGRVVACWVAARDSA